MLKDLLAASKNKRPPVWLVILVGVLFVGSLIFFFTVRAIPAEVTETTTELSYAHKGSFDYTVYLTPSYLYGPPPQEEVEEVENSQYPRAIIDDIEFNYRYAPVDESRTEVVCVYVVMSNPGIWEKSYKIYPYTAKTGSFNIRFELEPEDIEEMYEEIEDEIGLSSSSRDISLEVHVTAPNDEEFVQSLPVSIGSRLIEISNDLTHIEEYGNGEFNYAIYLEENSIWGDNVTLGPDTDTSSVEGVSLTPQTTLGPGDIIFTNLIDSMDLSYSYQFTADQPVSQVESEVVVSAILQALASEENGTGGGVLWSKRYTLLSQEEEGDFTIDIPMDYEYYTEMLENIRSETAASAGEYNVVINVEVYTVADTPAGQIKEYFAQTLTRTSSGGILEWKEDLTQTKSGALEDTVTVPNSDRYLGLSVTQAKLFAAVPVICLLIILLPVAALYFLNRPDPVTAGTGLARQVGNKYKQRISEAVGQLPTDGSKIVSLLSMEDLIKVADELGKPVIHEARPGEDEHSYYIVDGDTLYRYVIEGEPKPTVEVSLGYRDEVRRAISNAVKELGHSTSSGETRDNPDISAE